MSDRSRATQGSNGKCACSLTQPRQRLSRCRAHPAESAAAVAAAAAAAAAAVAAVPVATVLSARQRRCFRVRRLRRLCPVGRGAVGRLARDRACS
eukprot:950900-Pleurochrysis_carterae.AAC.3